jgi:hypothetical protein
MPRTSYYDTNVKLLIMKGNINHFSTVRKQIADGEAENREQTVGINHQKIQNG